MSAPDGARITALQVVDVRFPTSEHLDGSDAMNPEPDYSAAYVILHTDAADDLEGHALTFTTGRGNDVQTAAIASLTPFVVGRSVVELCSDLGGFSRDLVYDPQLRWMGPEKGVMHMAIGAVVNAAWDLAAKRAGQPVWRFLAEMSPEQLVSLVDFRYLTDALTPDEALRILQDAEPGRAERLQHLLDAGYPAYTTTPGWLGYSDEKLARLAREAVAEGFTQIKLKVGGSVEDDVRRMQVAREVLGPDYPIAIDANQRWDTAEAIEWMTALAPYDPYWIEEPTSPDDVLGHAAIRTAVWPTKVATGEHVQNRIIFKQLLQTGAIDVLQIDAARVGGINENVANLLLAAKFGVAVCPHAGGVGLCEMVQHLSMFDYVAVSGTTTGRFIEYVDHLHEHFLAPVAIRDGAYVAPTVPGLSAQMHQASLDDYRYPDGPQWARRLGATAAASAPGHAARRVGSVIRLRPEKEAEYRELHAAVWPDVLDQIARANIGNYSIFLRDGLLFSYFEYTGDDLDADLAAMAQDPRTRAWWTFTDPCQEPVETAAPGEHWAPAEEVFHVD